MPLVQEDESSTGNEVEIIAGAKARAREAEQKRVATASLNTDTMTTICWLSMVVVWIVTHSYTESAYRTEAHGTATMTKLVPVAAPVAVVVAQVMTEPEKEISVAKISFLGVF